MSRNRVIGRGNAIPWHLPEDFKWFKQMTTGQLIVMGRRTFESIGRPLPNRTTIVLTHSREPIPGVRLAHSLEEVVAARGSFACDCYICGGAEVYRQALPLCSDFYLTVVNQTLEGDACLVPFEECFEVAATVRETEAFTILHYRRCRLSPADLGSGRDSASSAAKD